MKVLVINAGSSSLKYQLIDMDGETLLAKGLCERIGIDGRFTYKPQLPGKAAVDAAEKAMPSHVEAIQAVLDALSDPVNGVVASMDEIGAVGHRVVHGGKAFTESCLIDSEKIEAIRRNFPLAPLHNPANLLGIEACQKAMPGKPQIAVFDTAFHMTMPAEAYIYAIPYEYYERDDVRRYGFHGTSHRYVTARCAELMGAPAHSRIISCHLGNGSSLAAVRDGKSVDTSMGLGPLAGVPMGTRCGDIDATILEYLMGRYGWSIQEAMNVLNKKSGMLGISGVSSDFRDLGSAAEQGNARAQLALDKFNYEVRKLVGAYAAAMGGVDAIVFTAGVGENDPSVRAGVCESLGYMGVKLCPERNAVRGGEHLISTDDSAVKVYVIATNEELMIARDTKAIVEQ